MYWIMGSGIWISSLPPGEARPALKRLNEVVRTIKLDVRYVRDHCAGRERFRNKAALLLVAPAPAPFCLRDDLDPLHQRSLLLDSASSAS